MKSHFKLLSLIAIIFMNLVAMVTLVSGVSIRETFNKEFHLESGGKVELDNTNGSVRISSWNRETIRIEAVKKVKAGSRSDAEHIMEKIEIEIEHDDDLITIDTHLPKRQGSGFWAALFSGGVEMSVSYEIVVPKEVDLELKTVNGTVEIKEIRGQIDAYTTNGAVKIYEVEGSVKAKTTNGAIEAELLEYDKTKEMRFKTTNGSISVYFPDDFAADIDAKTTNGSIKTDFPITVQGEYSRRRLSGVINGGGADVQLYTTNGSIKILKR